MARPPSPAEVAAPPAQGVETPDRPLAGIGLVILSTVFSSTSDATAKLLTGSLPGIEILWLRYIVFLAMTVGSILVGGKLRDFKPRRPDLQVVRALLIIASAILFMLGLAFLPIAEATTTFYIAPVFVTGLSILILKEVVGLRRWLATLAGLFGVMLVVRPGSDAFNAATLLPLASAAFWAGSLVVTRRMSAIERGGTTLFYSAAIGLVALSAMLPFVWVTPGPREIALGTVVGVAASVGQWIVIGAYRFAGPALLAPFSYMQIIWAAVSGAILFGDVPSFYVFSGAAIIIASGIYTAHRERIRMRAQRSAGVVG